MGFRPNTPVLQDSGVLNRDGTMTDGEIEAIITRVGEKKRPLDEVRDFSFAREALKELNLK